MQTIVLATQKGGSGKSTLAIGLALAAMEAGHTVSLVETDPQGTLSNWQSRRADPAPIVEPVYNALELEPRLQALQRSGVTVTIVDTAGGISAATTAAIRYSDLCLIPVRPSIVDIEATVSTLELARIWRKPFGFRAQPDPDPRPPHQQCRHRARRRSRARYSRDPSPSRSSSCATIIRTR